MKKIENDIGLGLDNISKKDGDYKSEVISNFHDIGKYGELFEKHLTNGQFVHSDYLIEKIYRLRKELDNIELICIKGQEKDK